MDSDTKLGQLTKLRWDKIGNCQRCRLGSTRKKLVFGEGDPGADFMFIGEGPGFCEDVDGRPFVGPAGTLLNRLLRDAGFAREKVYITNVVKCRPPQNRDPEPNEIEACSPYLHAQIWVVRPKVLIALGRLAGNMLAGTTSIPMRELQQRMWRYHNDSTKLTLPIHVMPHPAYLLRQLQDENTRGAAVTLYRQLVDKLKALQSELDF